MSRSFAEQPHGASRLWAWASVFSLMASGVVCAESNLVFSAPSAYPLERYVGGWNKNPFTLRTVPVVAAKVSFAIDLTIAAYYGDAEYPTVVVVNTKTGERTKLKKTQPAANGMQLKDVKLGAGRKDVSAEVTLGTETSDLRFNDEYTKQLAAAETTNTPAGQPPSARPAGAPVPGRPPLSSSQQSKAPLLGATPSPPKLGIPVPASSRARGKPATKTVARPLAQSAGVTTKTSSTAGSNARVPTSNAAQPVLTRPVVATGNTPMASRRRLVTPAAN